MYGFAGSCCHDDELHVMHVLLCWLSAVYSDNGLVQTNLQSQHVGCGSCDYTLFTICDAQLLHVLGRGAIHQLCASDDVQMMLHCYICRACCTDEDIGSCYLLFSDVHVNSGP